jgi:D-tagatose-1,6-bisphosphate aldolase subunit GatZ/KbaZ
MSDRLSARLQAHKQGEARGLASICSAHPFVLQTAIQSAVRTGSLLLVESTCNQVNQFGGYTGLDPASFAAWLRSLAAQNGLPPDRLILGGDHLGPSAWQAEPAEVALAKAGDLVQACVRAGYAKIHLDASMRLGGDDPSAPLPVELVARRAAGLARLAEAAADPESPPRYVIGSEVPVPGGARESETGVQVTTPAGLAETIETHERAFIQAGLPAAWERVLAVVVQPGVEFGDDFVLEYRPEAAAELSRFVETTPFVFEAHSTDYQPRQALRNLVRDHFAVLKVGPALTHTYREAVFALAAIEAELVPAELRSRLIETLDSRMLADPQHWQAHYHGSPDDVAHKRLYSQSDRLRYYWPDAQVQAALTRLLENLGTGPLPAELVARHTAGLAGDSPRTAAGILAAGVQRVLEEYAAACGD